MKTATLLAGLLSLTTVLQACMGDAPKMPETSSTSSQALSADASLTSVKAQCPANKMILASTGGGHFTWGANKGTNPTSTAEIPVIGTTELAGCIYPKMDGAKPMLTGGSVKIDFKPELTQSFNELRDHRIIQYIFGYDLPADPEGSVDNTASTGLLRLTVDSISTAGLEVPTVEGTSVSIKAQGTLQIAGFKVPLEIPVALTKTNKGWNAMNNESFTVNIRGGSPAKNTLGLDKRVTEILALVAPGTLQDIIDLSFNVDFVDLCAN